MPPKSEKLEDKQYFSILQWITERGIVNENGEPFDFYDRPFLLDILTDFTPEIVCTACAQVGKSVTFSIKTLFATKHLKFNCIYTFPTDDDVKKFVKSKMNKIIQSNRQDFGEIDGDSVEMKEIKGRFIYFQGTISKTAAISDTADLLIHDELSRSDQSKITTYKSRTKASKYKGRWLFSNPGVERDELDLAWQKSDQKEWTVTCPACKVEQYLVWPDNIDIENKCYICSACKVPFPMGDTDPRRHGKWVAQAPGKKISGYHISHLMCPWITAEEIIEDSQGDPAYFNNFVLGKPYSPGDLSVSRTTILDLWTPKPLHTGNKFLGVDVGNIKHWSLRTEKGVEKIGRFANWQELDDLIAIEKPTAGVIDANPDNTAARHYVATYPFMQMSFFMENNNNPQTIVWWGEGDKLGIVYSHRDRILDRMLTDMIEAVFLIGIVPGKEFQDYIKHYETLRRVKVINNKGIERYVWESTTGVDHYVFADLYSYLAMLGAGAGVFYGQNPGGEQPSVLGADNVYDVSQMFRHNNQNGG